MQGEQAGLHHLFGAMMSNLRLSQRCVMASAQRVWVSSTRVSMQLQ